jgi:hypothetical protein
MVLISPVVPANWSRMEELRKSKREHTLNPFTERQERAGWSQSCVEGLLTMADKLLCGIQRRRTGQKTTMQRPRRGC